MIKRILNGIRKVVGMGILGVMVTACQNPGHHTQDSGQSVTGPPAAEGMGTADMMTADTPAYSYDTFRMNSVFPFADSVKLNDTTHYQIEFPFFENRLIQAFVTRVQLGTDTMDAQTAARQFIGEYEAYQDSFPFPRAWTYESSTKVNNLTPFYLSLKTDHYNYTGGAHGMYAIVFSHYWLPTHEELKFADLIDTGRMADFLPIAERHFWAQEKQNNPDMDAELYFFADQEFHVPENLNFEKDSLLFLYNIYEIKPYVYGYTELRVPYSEIQEFLTEKAKQIVLGINKKR